MTVVLLAAACFTWLDANDNHAVRRIGDAPVPLGLNDYFKKWADARGTKQHPYPVFLIATEGGGIRAACDTAVVLGGLQDENPEFFEHVFAISGVSGGSVGATVFSAYYKSCHANGVQPKPEEHYYTAFATNTFSQDYLSPVLGMALFPDLLQRFIFPDIPWFDRARGLEKAFERSVTNQSASLLTKSYFDWHKPYNSGPALLLNTTEVKSGRRMTMSPFTFCESNYCKPLLPWDVNDNCDVSLSSAMVLSARFPIVTPAGYFIHSGANEQTKYRFVDGGYYENSGTATLLDILSVLRTNDTYRFYVIRIGHAFESDTSTNKARALPKYGKSGFDELSPIFAVMNAREARGDDATHELSDALQAYGMSDMIEFTWKQNGVALPLGWYISEAACDNLVQQFQTNVESRKMVHDIVSRPAVASVVAR